MSKRSLLWNRVKLGAALVLAVCGSVQAQSAGRSFRGPPIRADAEWRVSAATVDLVNPLGLAAIASDSAVVLDFGDRMIKLVATRGTQWTYGSRGSGPGEMQAPAGLSAGRGSLWYADRGTGRVGHLAHDGTFRRELVLGYVPSRVLEFAAGRLAVWSALDSVIRVLDATSGMQLGALPLPRGARGAHVLARADLFLVALPADRFAVLFQYGAPLAIYSASRLLTESSIVDGGPFPEVKAWKMGNGYSRVGPDPKAPRQVAGATVLGDKLIVLWPSLIRHDNVDPRGNSDLGDVLDFYSTTDGRYLYSSRLPRPAYTITAAGPNRLFSISRDPEPAVLAWLVHEGEGARRP